eukprot:scaffold97_cov261-Pinguiococcus_pyrenoidosus.AAC.4
MRFTRSRVLVLALAMASWSPARRSSNSVAAFVTHRSCSLCPPGTAQGPRRAFGHLAQAATSNMHSLDAKTWQLRKQAYEERLAPVLKHRDRDHPIFNFLWKYYTLKPQKVLRWSPGPHVVLEDFCPSSGAASRHAHTQGWHTVAAGGYYDCRLMSPDRVRRLAWARDVLYGTTRRAPMLNCYGLHEWAMLYRPEGESSETVSKHQGLPLRVSQQTLNAVVEERPLRCTHTDAVRFFAPSALPLLAAFDRARVEEAAGQSVDEIARTRGQRDAAALILEHGKVPNRNLQPALEQPGCVHATMDLFKWSSKLAPFVSRFALSLRICCNHQSKHPNHFPNLCDFQ